MEFDKSRVYIALNAEELQVGSMVLFEDRLCLLKCLVENNATPDTLEFVRAETYQFRFLSETDFALAYLIAPPAEPEYKPFSDNKTALHIIGAHGGWLKGDGKTGKAHFFVTGFDIGCGDEDEIKIESVRLSTEYVFKHFVFADDDSPVGVTGEEDREET